MHFFLTGDIQVGKSTVVQRVIRELSTSIGGFKTFFTVNRQDMNRALYMSELTEPVNADKAQLVVQFVEGKPHVFTERFDALGKQCLQRARAQSRFIIMDECGKFEQSALVFQQEIAQTLDGDTPVLGVVRQQAGLWTQAIHAHPGVTVLLVTLENRDTLPPLLTQWYTSHSNDAYKELMTHAQYD